MKTPLQQKHKIILTIHFISAAALIFFWAGYYSLPLFGVDLPSVYTGLSFALPAPDGLLVLLMIAAGWLILRRHNSGIVLSYIVSGVLVFLGIAGFRLELSNGLLLVSMVSVLKSGFINLWCIVFGLYFLLKLKEKKAGRQAETGR